VGDVDGAKHGRHLAVFLNYDTLYLLTSSVGLIAFQDPAITPSMAAIYTAVCRPM